MKSHLKRIKKTISVFIAIIIGFSFLAQTVVYAGTPNVTSVVFTTLVDNDGTETYSIAIYGSYMGGLSVQIGNDYGNCDLGKIASTSTVDPTISNSLVNFPLDPDMIANRTTASKATTMRDIIRSGNGKIFVGGVMYPINPTNLPSVSTTNPTRVYTNSKNIDFIGNHFDALTTGGTGPQVTIGIANTALTHVSINTDGTKLTIPDLNGIVTSQGNWNIDVKRITPSSGAGTAQLTEQTIFVKKFKVIADLSGVDEDHLIYTPNTGVSGATVANSTKFMIQDTTPSGTTSTNSSVFTEDKSIFFLKDKDLANGYDIKYMSPSTKVVQDEATGKFKGLNVVVPTNIPSGIYYLAVTNKVTAGQDPNQTVTSEHVMSKTPFTVVDGAASMQVLSITPTSGSDTGIDASVLGKYVASLDAPDLTASSSPTSQQTLDSNSTLRFIYDNNVKYKGNSVYVTKDVHITVGNKATFDLSKPDPQFQLSPESDKILFHIAPITVLAQESKDVRIDTETVIRNTYAEVARFSETAVLPGGFTFQPSIIKPILSSVTPNVGDRNSELHIAIKGSNLIKYAYSDPVTKTTKYKYPKVKIGSLTIQQNPNYNGSYNENSTYDSTTNTCTVNNMEVLDSNNNPIDGTKKSMYGNMIVLTIPQGITRDVGKLNVTVQNPVINSVQDAIGDSATLEQAIEIMTDEKSSSDKPFITDVSPNMIGVDGNVDIVIKGSNFKPDSLLTIDGQVITPRIVDGKGESITFKAPPYRATDPNAKLLQVINPNGGVASYYFSYTKTYTNPSISSIVPDKGKATTVVTITGQNFITPDTTATPTEIQRLLGTTVKFDGGDLNNYNVDTNNRVRFIDYKFGNVFNLATGKLSLNPNYESVMFQNPTVGFSALYRGRDNTIHLKDEKGQEYSVYAEADGKIYAKNTSNVVTELTTGKDPADGRVFISFNGVNYYAVTPYVVDSNGDIIGKHTFVKDDTTIEVVVPSVIEGVAVIEGSKNVTVVNPDTKSVSKAGGFYYYAQPKTKPVIESITPSQGSQTGGNVVKIVGNDFYDGIGVYFGSQQVPAANVTVTTENGKSVINAVVPAYPGDILKDKGVSKLSVSVVVVNTDGGSASARDGYEYLVPVSHPKISQISPTKASTTGGDTVTILGSDFRDSEPYTDSNGNGKWDTGEPFIDVNGNTIWDKASTKDANGNYDDTNRALLPKVFFGGQAAKVVDFSSVKVYNGGTSTVMDKIDCILPKAYSAGAVDVSVINADGGTATSSKGFTYTKSGPNITSMVPNVGPKVGGTTVSINGSGFIKKDLNVRFGDFTNASLNISDNNSGNIVASKASVVIGNLTAAYSIVNQSTANPEGTQRITLTGSDGTNSYTKAYDLPDEGYMYINLGNKTTLSPDGSKTLNGLGMPNYDYENVKIDISGGRLIVTRGFCANVNWASDQLITVLTPPVAQVGTYPVYVINGDGGTGTSTFKYTNPSSKPVITNVLRSGQNPKSEVLTTGVTAFVQDVPSKGNIQLTIVGSDFRDNAKVMIGEKEAKIDSITAGNIVITVPAGEDVLDKLLRIVVTNEDGASANSGDNAPPIYVRYKLSESDVAIDSITPNIGTMKGGTSVTIKGKGFKTGAVVRFGGQAATNVVIVDYKTITCVTPAMNSASSDYVVNVEVENTDYGIAIMNNGFTYISAPEIKELSQKTASIQGGEVITIKGLGFIDGATVYFGPTVIDYKDDATKGTIIYINGVKKLLTDGIKATKVEFVDSNTLKVTVPSAPLSTKGIIVVNKDGGASDIYGNFTFTLAKPQAPTNLKVELVYNKYVRVTWTPVDGVDYYEVYRIVNGQYSLVDNVKTPSYIERNLVGNTLYEFTVRAVKDSVPSDYSEIKGVTTPANVDVTEPDENPLNQSSIEIGNGGSVTITIGIKNPIDSADLTDSKYASAKNVIINMPAYFINHSSRIFTLTVEGGSIVVPATAFKVREIQNLSADDEAYAVGRAKVNLEDDDTIRRRIPNGNLIVSKMFTVEGEIQIGKKVTRLDQFTDSLKMTIAYDESSVTKVKGAKYVANAFYYDYDKTAWMPLSNSSGVDSYKSMSSNSTGTFIIMLERKR